MVDFEVRQKKTLSEKSVEKQAKKEKESQKDLVSFCPKKDIWTAESHEGQGYEKAF